MNSGPVFIGMTVEILRLDVVFAQTFCRQPISSEREQCKQ